MVRCGIEAVTRIKMRPKTFSTGTQLLEALPVGVAIIIQGRFGYTNQHLLTLLGLDHADELLGQSIWNTAIAEDRFLIKSRYHRSKYTQRLTESYTYHAKRRDREMVCLEVSTKAIEVAGESAELARFIDVTKLKATQSALEESEIRCLAVLNEIEDGFGEMDLAGKVTFCNDAFHRIYGYPKAELIGLDYRCYLDTETAEKVYQAYNQVYVTGISNKGFAYEIICKDGDRRFIENSISLKKDGEGNPIGFRSIVRDITERRRAQEELFRHRSRLNAIFSSVRDAVITVDTKMTVIEANKAVQSVCGMCNDRIVGKRFSNLELACTKSCIHIIKKILNGKEFVNDHRIECHQDKVAMVNCSHLKGTDNRFLGAVMVIRDISRLNELEKELKERSQFYNIIGKSNKMQEIYRLVEELADIETTVLITGESGTGKELVAKAIHNSGKRAFKNFVPVNCSALTETLLESELFGHVKGAFTGAIKDRQGRFMMASGGTILLDEIGEISQQIQVKLLRVLQEKELERVGDTKTLKVDARVIACTNQDLKQLTSKRLFREDLYYRLKVVEIKLPPLREHREDIPLLVEHFCQVLNRRFQKQIKGVSSEVLQMLMNYHWPGNVRELEHAMERAYILCHDHSIQLSDLPPEISKMEENPKTNNGRHASSQDEQIKCLTDALKKTDGNKAKAARILGVDRGTIYRRIKKFKLYDWVRQI